MIGASAATVSAGCAAYQSAAQQLSCEVLGGTLHLVEVESDVLAQIGIGARDVDFATLSVWRSDQLSYGTGVTL